MEIEKAARDFYSKHAGAELGDVVSIDKQVVSGINFKMTFKSSNQSNVVIVVYSQPWTKTIRVSSVLPPIKNATDESGRVTIDITQNWSFIALIESIIRCINSERRYNKVTNIGIWMEDVNLVQRNNYL